MGKKKDAAKRAELERREREIAAELERRAAEKAAKKKAKKKAGKKSKPAELTPADADVVVPVADERPKHPHLAHLDRIGELTKIIADPTSKKKAVKAAEEELERYRRETLEREAAKAVNDEELKAKIAAKRAEREAKSPTAAAEPRDVKAARMPDALEGETEVEYQHRKLAEKKAARKAEKATGADPVEAELIARATEAVEAVKAAVEVVETEAGREFVAGEAKSDPATVVEEDFAKPSEAEPVLEEGRNGYKIIMLDAEGKPDKRRVRQLTRVTTFVGNIDDETTLKKWDKRMVAEGLARNALEPREAVPFVTEINDVVHRRDVKISKAIKADRKGKLGIGEVGRLVAAAEKEAKDALDKLVEEAAALAGRNDKANFGTHLHTLAEIADAKGIDAVRELHESGELVAHDNDGKDGLEPMPVTATDLASIEAYAARMARLGAKVIEAEAVIVNDAMGYAGRLDRIIAAKLPELTLSDGTKRPADTRARRYVTDIKSGRIDLGAGKIARQLAAYALGDLYDLETGERTSHRAARDVALVFHLPQGEGVCTVHAVDIKSGAALLKLSAEVRRARNTGKKTIDTSVDIADPSTESEAAE